MGIIPMQKKKPTRMCIACRRRESQKDLIRLQLKDKRVTKYTGSGRSFYLCYKCANDGKKLRGISRRLGVEQDDLLAILKEFTAYGED